MSGRTFVAAVVLVLAAYVLASALDWDASDSDAGFAWNCAEVEAAPAFAPEVAQAICRRQELLKLY